MMKHWSVGIRLGLGFAFILSGLLAIASVSRWAILTLSDTITSLYQDNAVAGTELAKMSTALLRYRNQVIQIIGVQSKDDFQEMQAELPKLETDIRQYLTAYKGHTKGTSGTHDEKAESVTVEKGIEDYFSLEKRTIDRMKSSMEARDSKETERLRQAAIQNSFYGAGPTMNMAGESLDQLLSTVAGIASDSKQTGEETIAKAQAILLGVFGICLLLGVLSARLLLVSITRPLKALSHAVGLIAGGNLKARSAVMARDEMGMLAKAFNDMGDKLEQAAAKQQEMVSTLNNAKANLVICDRNLCITYVNKGAEATFAELASPLRLGAPTFDPVRLIGGSIVPLLECSRTLRASVDDPQYLPVREDVLIGPLLLDVTINSLPSSTGDLLGYTMEWVNVSHMRQAERTVSRMQSALEYAGTNFIIVDESEQVIFLNKAARESLKQEESELRAAIPGFNVDKILGESFHSLFKDPGTLKHLVAELKANPVRHGEVTLGSLTFDYQVRSVCSVQGERLAYIVEWRDVTQERRTQHLIDALVQGATQGRLSDRMKLEKLDGVYLAMSRNMNRLLDAISVPMKEVGLVMKALASCDLTVTMQGQYAGEFEEMRQSLNKGMYNLTQTVVSVREAVESVTAGAEGITNGNEDLSRRTSEQAGALEETSTSMEEMTATVKQNADNALKANQLAIAARDTANKGGIVTNQAIDAMGEINKSSKKIADIITVIDEIAFQTNLLALNAAVEAARAGEHGRGFAVVAAEVRNLAQRSAMAAKQIKSLINESIQRVTEGSALVDQSGKTLEDIVHSVKRVSDIIAEITAASQEQASGIDQVNKAIMAMDQTTQQNTTLVEELASTTKSVQEQTRELYHRVLGFKIGNSEEEKAFMPAVHSLRTYVAETIDRNYKHQDSHSWMTSTKRSRLRDVSRIPGHATAGASTPLKSADGPRKDRGQDSEFEEF
ncbi:MAG: HAMP domain-containing protein [Nitrospira sp.]|nr:HAMP domain-containing protein [Nitrospira sp.]